MKKSLQAILSLLAIAGSVQAQTATELHITHKWGGAKFEVNKTAKNDLGNDIAATNVSYYISNITIWHDGGQNTAVASDHIILAKALQDVISPLGSFNITKVDSVVFYLGVDATTNLTDPSKMPANHPLALQNPSMHWGWAGYIFVAMDGKSGASLAKSYSIHALENPLYTKVVVPVTGVMKNGKLMIALDGEYTKALSGIDVSAGVVEHGSGLTEASLISNFSRFVFSQGTPATVNEAVTENNGIDVYPNPAYGGKVLLSFGNSAAAGIVVTDLSGRIVLQQQKTAMQNNLTLQLQQAGMYFITVQYADGNRATAKLSVY